MSIATQLWENRKQSRKRHLLANGALRGRRKRPINDNSKSNQRELSRRGELFGRSGGCLLARAAGYPDGKHPDQGLAPDGGDCEKVLGAFSNAGIDIDALAQKLQDDGAASFDKSWNDLMACIESKSAVMRKAS